MLFILQSGFSSFTFSRRMFLELYLHFGRQLLYSLAYLTASPFLVLSFSHSYKAVTWLYTLYLVYFINATLDYAKEEGYIITIHSNRFVPRHYGRIRAYFRYIRNRGILKNIFLLFPVVLLFLYPFILSITNTQSLYLTETAVFYSCFIPLFYTLYKITKFIPEFFAYTGIEMTNSNNQEKSSEEQSEEEKHQNLVEKKALKKYLLNHGVTELNPSTYNKFIDGDISVNFLDTNDDEQAWFNIDVNISNATIEEIRKNILEYAHSFAKRLQKSKVSINNFVLSFHIQIGKQSSRNMFFRISRRELNNIFELNEDKPEDMANLKNVLFDELFRE